MTLRRAQASASIGVRKPLMIDDLALMK